MSPEFSRRDFLKTSLLALGGLAMRPLKTVSPNTTLAGKDLARVAIQSVSVYSEPNDKSKIQFQRYRDELVNIYYEVVSKNGPDYNPLWYRVWGGYIHSAHLQRVNIRLNPVAASLNRNKQLAEVTVPTSPSYLFSKMKGWTPLYKLYYQSIHWVVGVEEGPDGQPWYRIKDEAFDIDQLDYFTPAQNLRLVEDSEFSPVSTGVAPEKKRIEVSIGRQELTAYEGDTVILHTKISSGIPMGDPPPGQPSTDTPKGEFHIQNKMPSKHMGDGNLTSDPEAYELPGVPWVCFFEPETGVATHGTYWHNNYGTTMSHGCVNMKTEEALFIFRWATPIYPAGEWDVRGYGTRVLVS